MFFSKIFVSFSSKFLQLVYKNLKFSIDECIGRALEGSIEKAGKSKLTLSIQQLEKVREREEKY